MTIFSDVMVDLETTHTMPDRGNILEIGAVKFNLETREIDHNFFNRAMSPLPHRCWSESTRSWWMTQNQDVLRGIMLKMEHPTVVMRDFVDWAAPAGSLRFWAKPAHFDYNFLSSYFTDLELPQMFSFRDANDMNTFLRSQYWPAPVPADNLAFVGDVHTGLMDSLHQIGVLFHHMDMLHPVEKVAA